jgi:cold shock protein
MAKQRNNRRGSRRQEWDDDGPSDFQEPSCFSRRPEVTETDAVDAQVLWFNSVKGFGFVQPSTGEKAFLHIRQLEAAGLSDIAEGAQLRVVIQPRPKGMNVTRIVEVLSAPTAHESQEAPREVSASAHGDKPEETTGTVKWYNSEKGFGFVARDEGGKGGDDRTA